MNFIMPSIPADLTQLEGQKLLANLEDQAHSYLLDADKSLTASIVILDIIRQFGLYGFGGYAHFGDYLQSFIDTKGIARSTTQKYLKVLRLWSSGLGRKPEDLMLLPDGIRTPEPLLIGGDSVVGDYDTKTGMIYSVADRWDGVLPQGDTPADRINAAIDSMNLGELSTSMVRDAIKKSAPPEFEYSFGFVFDGISHKPKLIKWKRYSRDGGVRSGVGFDTMPGDVLDDFAHRCRITEIEV